MTGCDPADINYNLCQALIDRLADEQQRLDLVWWAAWALVGFCFVAIAAYWWRGAWGLEGKTGRG